VDSLLLRATGSDDISTSRVDRVEVQFSGFCGECHSGLTRKSCVRVAQQYNEGTEIRNTRQISVVSVEELSQIADDLKIERLLPEWLGANLSLAGIPDLTLLPPSSRLIFSSGASIVIDMENEPCRYPAELIEKHHPGHGRYFVKRALNKRGLTGWVEREGTIQVGDKVTVHMPPQRVYPHV